DQHLNFFLQYTERADEAFSGQNMLVRRAPDVLVWLDRLELEADNVHAALEWGLEKRPEDVLNLALQMRGLWNVRGEAGRIPDPAWFEMVVGRVAALPPVEGEAARKRLRARTLGMIDASNYSIVKGDRNNGRAVINE